MNTLPFEPRRFRSTAAYFARFRVPYPQSLIADVAERVKLGPDDRVLDLGCGPGLLAIAFARLGMEVLGLDPEAEMLAAAREDAAAAGVAIRFEEGSSYDLSAELGTFRLATMGRSFHWMDRSATLAALDGLIQPGGAIALFHDHRIATKPDWPVVFDLVSEKYMPEGSLLRRLKRDKQWLVHESVLLDSVFSDLATVGRVIARTITADDIVGRALSMSATSPEALGNRRESFEAEMRARLAEISPSGAFSEIVRPEALIAFRPGWG